MAHTASLSQLQTPQWALVNGELVRYEDVRIHISAEALTRALSVFEGLKGYWNKAGNVFSVRSPRQHYNRLCRSAALLHIPVAFTYEEFVAGLATLGRKLLVPDQCLWFRTTLYATQGHWGEGTVADLVVTAFTQRKHDPDPMRLGVSTWRRAADVALPTRVKCSAKELLKLLHQPGHDPVEADAAGVAVPESTWLVLLRMTDALAAVVDAELQPPRQGDADDGRGLVVDGDGADRWASLLATGSALFGRQEWWPAVDGGDVRTPLLTALTGPHQRYADPRSADATRGAARPAHRPSHFADAGLTILRVPPRDSAGEIWCRCDGGPHGFLSIAAHAHADALSVEVRHDGVDVLADPGCYCYHGDPQWRSYFRSTLGHNTLELDGEDQSRSGGPFLWTRHARSRVLVARARRDGVSRWRAEHDGYGRRGSPVVHRRSIELDSASRELRVLDEVTSSRWHRCRLAYHLGPRIAVDLDGRRAQLRWADGGWNRSAVLKLPGELTRTAHRGETTRPSGGTRPGSVAGNRLSPSSVVDSSSPAPPSSARCSASTREPGEANDHDQPDDAAHPGAFGAPHPGRVHLHLHGRRAGQHVPMMITSEQESERAR